jgi:hypothetical protein
LKLRGRNPSITGPTREPVGHADTDNDVDIDTKFDDIFLIILLMILMLKIMILMILHNTDVKNDDVDDIA